ncbi:hypothetical protein [Synechocystis sp. PCC 6714]|uniref:hypothetical protein n=1 Tax=Synechocystis sp. (strain PCC 6714) TaxID=1147 RepID=UPI00041AC397|nr:hypothetical protein [Synechocystis sp. PCC 6714]AIE74297.1 hypothetical protein D082_17690 [Synechocystis sp. PCC 6714]
MLATIPTIPATVATSINVQPDDKPSDRENSLRKIDNLLRQTIGQHPQQDH